MSNEDRPLFMQPGADLDETSPDGNPDAKPDLPAYDRFESFPERPEYLSERQWKVAWYHTLGKTNNEICELLGYTPAWVSTMLGKPAMIAEVNRLRSHMHGDAMARMKRLDHEATAVMEQHIRSDDPLKDRVQTAIKVHEFVHGKAKQAVDIKNTYIDYVAIKVQLAEEGKLDEVPKLRDVGPAPEAPQPEPGQNFSKWFVDDKP